MNRNPEDEELVRSFVAAIDGLSDREAADRVGLSHERIRQFRTGAWVRFNAATRREMRAFAAIGAHPSLGYREGLLYAAGEMEQKAADLREMAATVSLVTEVSDRRPGGPGNGAPE